MEFIKLISEITPESELLNHQKSLGIKIQSVALPNNNYFILPKKEADVIDWLENKVHNVYTAFHKINSKYTGDTEKVNWNNNKSQNERFLETKNMYKDFM